MKLGQSTLTPAECVAEARDILYKHGLGSPAVITLMPLKAQRFVSDLLHMCELYPDRVTVSPNQLFWLRDLKDKYT